MCSRRFASPGRLGLRGEGACMRAGLLRLLACVPLSPRRARSLSSAGRNEAGLRAAWISIGAACFLAPLSCLIAQGIAHGGGASARGRAGAGGLVLGGGDRRGAGVAQAAGGGCRGNRAAGAVPFCRFFDPVVLAGGGSLGGGARARWRRGQRQAAFG